MDTAASAEAPAKPRRAARKKKETPASDASVAPVSDEVAQARALAQISQASVARSQRRAAEKAADLIADAGEEEPAKPKRRRATRSKVAASTETAGPAAVASDTVANSSEVSSADTDAEPKKRTRRSARSRKVAATSEMDSEVTTAEGAVPAGEAAPTLEGASVQDAPAKKPRRTRRVSASVADDVHGANEAKRVDEAPSVEGAVNDKAEASESASGESSAKEDKRPGRARRAAVEKAKGQKEQTVDAPADATDADQKPSKGSDGADAKSETQNEPEADSERGKNRRHQNRRERGDGRDNERNGNRNERGGDRKNRNDRNDRKNRRDRNNRNNAPVEPSISRDDLAAMKVAELREKAKELDLDPAGKKKAELVEEIYTTNARIEGFRDIEGILEIAHDGFGYIRAHGYMPSKDDAFVAANLIRAARLRTGDVIAGTLRPSRANDKFPGLAKIKTVNGLDPEEIRRRPKFSELTPIYPNEPLKMEHGRDSITGRAIDIVSPIGKGQRGLIVSPPKAGKTTILKKICQSISINNPEVHLICLLVDERPEEVTDMQRSIKGDVVASTFDMPADNHTRVSELVIERAKRIVELGGDVVVVLDSITRLARAYNLAAPASGRILSGGVDSAALYPPKRFLGAARNIENGGSLTILASALIDTGSKMDEVIFEEFKGTGNMELKLDRDLADRRIFPAINPVASGTRNEDLLLDESMRPFVWGIRRILANMNNTERAAASFIKGLKGTDSNQEFLIRTAKKAQDHEGGR